MPTSTKQDKKAGAGDIAPAKGKLGVMIPGMGAVATTFVAGVEAVRKGISAPIGSLTQMGTIRLGKRTEGRSPKIKDFVPLAGLNDLVFTGWDIFEDDMYSAAGKAGVLDTLAAGPGQAVPLVDQAAQGRLRQELRQEARRPEREEGQEQDGSRRAAARRHPRLQEVERRRPPGHDLVRLDRNLHRSPAPCTRSRRSLRKGDCAPTTRASRRR